LLNLKKKLKLLLTKEEGKISKLSLALASLVSFNIKLYSEIYVKAGHLNEIGPELQSCIVSTEAGFDYGGLDWSDVNWFNNVALKCNLAKIWNNIVSYGYCCGYTFTWNDIIT